MVGYFARVVGSREITSCDPVPLVRRKVAPPCLAEELYVYRLRADRIRQPRTNGAPVVDALEEVTVTGDVAPLTVDRVVSKFRTERSIDRDGQDQTTPRPQRVKQYPD